MGKKKTEAELRAHGYMTVDEFVDKFSESLRGYMYSNWPTSKDELHHPEDLASNALVYTEVMYRVLGDF